MKYTHYGWFGFCPVYLANPFSHCPDVVARKAWLHWLLKLNVFVQQVSIATCKSFNEDWEPAWKIRLSGKLSSPVRC